MGIIGMPGSTGSNSRDGSPADPVGDLDRAEEMCRRAIEADPDNTDALGDYANFLADYRGDYDRAEEMYRRAIEADPDDSGGDRKSTRLNSSH